MMKVVAQGAKFMWKWFPFCCNLEMVVLSEARLAISIKQQ